MSTKGSRDKEKETLAKNLESFAASLEPEEQVLFTQQILLDRGSVASVGKINAAVIRKLLDW